MINLIELMKVPNKGSDESLIRKYISEKLIKMKIHHWIDTLGNIFNITQPDRPILSAHLDSVMDDNDIKKLKFVSSFIHKKQRLVAGKGVIGADDKCGIFTILSLLERRKDFNFILCSREERGGTGINYFLQNHDISSFPWALVIDRRNSHDLICSKNNYGTIDFEQELLKYGKNFGFQSASGIFSDANFISKKISCANISCGYYNPHTIKEFLVVEELINSIKFVDCCLTNVKEKFVKTEERNYYSGYSENWEKFSYIYNKDTKKYTYCFPNYDDEEEDDEEEVLTCPECNAIVEDCDFFCDECGYSLTKDYLCPVCGEELETFEKYSYCSDCGYNRD